MFMHETRRGCDDTGARPIRRADPERAAKWERVVKSSGATVD